MYTPSPPEAIVMTLPDFLHKGSMGEIRFVGSRIDLYFVIEAYNQGWPAEAIALRYDSLRLADIQKAVEFYHGNRADVDAYVQGVIAEIEHLEATMPRVDIAAIRERLAKREARLVAQAPGAE
jgi:uncharacterized protein (DUF433 family)